MATVEPTEKKEQTFPCRICNRQFIKSSLEKHESACKKLTKMQRKVFDSGKQRASNSDIPINDVRKVQKEREKLGGVFPRPQTNWRERHEEFIGAVSASKQVGNALKTGGPLPPPPKTASNADYIRCDFCGRSFNKNAAERHIEFCKEQSARKAILSKQGFGRRRNTESAKSRPKTRSSLTSSSGTSSLSSHNGTNAKNSKILTNQHSLNNQRRPSGSSTTSIHRVSESVERKTPNLNTRLPQPTKRSNSAPRGKEVAQLGKSNSVSGKSTFSTPKSAGTSSIYAIDNRLAKKLSKQHI